MRCFNAVYLFSHRHYAGQCRLYSTKISNFRANLMISSFISKQPHSLRMTETERTNVMKEVLRICDLINGKKDVFVLEQLLRICFDFGHFDKLQLFWPDIESIADLSRLYPLLIKCLIECGDIEKCVQCFDWMKCANYTLKVSDIYIIKLVNNPRATLLHLRFIEDLMSDGVVASASNDGNMKFKTAMIEIYAQKQSIGDSKRIFCSIAQNERMDVVAVCAVMSTLLKNGCYEDAIEIYEEVEGANRIQLDEVAHSLAIKAMTKAKSSKKERKIRQIWLDSDSLIVKTSLIDFYGSNSLLDCAVRTFESIDDAKRDCAVFGAMMAAFLKNSCCQRALALYRNMKIAADEICHCLALKAAKKENEIGLGHQIIASIEKPKSIKFANTLIDFYGHCGDIESAKGIFFGIAPAERDTVCINAMMNALLQNKLNRECLDLFESARFEADTVSFTTAIIACTKVSHLQSLHSKLDALHCDALPIQISLISQYAKFGHLSVCKEIFDRMKGEFGSEIVLWNAMIASFAKHGHLAEATNLFFELKQVKNLRADAKTLAALLGGCSHSFDAEQALNIWSNHIDDDCIKFDCFVVAALVDTFCRSGYLHRGYEAICEYEHFTKHKESDHIMWTSMLSACRNYNNRLMAQHVYQQILKRFEANEEFLEEMDLLHSNIHNKTIEK